MLASNNKKIKVKSKILAKGFYTEEQMQIITNIVITDLKKSQINKEVLRHQ